MPYLVCERCGEYYELQVGESSKDFVDRCACGGKIRVVENLDDIPQDFKTDISRFKIGFIAVLIIFSILAGYFVFLQGLNANAKTDKSVLSSALANKTHYENVYANTDADVYRFISKKPGKKFAFVLGVHPYEWEAHQAFYDTISKYASSSQFKGQIDVYWIHVPPLEAENYNAGRAIGEKSANSFIVPRIQKKKYYAVFDVHSAWQDWPYQGRPKWYMLYASTNQSRALSNKISKNLNWDSTLGYVGNNYGYYVANPIASSGTPDVMLEWGYCKPEYLYIRYGEENLYAKDPGEYEDKSNHALNFLQNMNNL
jgi:hypothetical protein